MRECFVNTARNVSNVPPHDIWRGPVSTFIYLHATATGCHQKIHFYHHVFKSVDGDVLDDTPILILTHMSLSLSDLNLIERFYMQILDIKRPFKPVFCRDPVDSQSSLSLQYSK